MTTYHHGNLRPALIEAAVDLARTKGPDGVVLREAARRTGVSHNAAYRHFADREALLTEVANTGMDRLEAAIRRRIDAVSEPDPARAAQQRLRETGRAYIEFALAEPGLFEVAFECHPPATDGGDSPSAGPYGLLNQALDDLVAIGSIPGRWREGADVACWATVHGFAMLNLHGPLRGLPDDERDHLLEGMLDVLERGLFKRT